MTANFQFEHENCNSKHPYKKHFLFSINEYMRCCVILKDKQNAFKTTGCEHVSIYYIIRIINMYFDSQNGMKM